MLIEGRIPALRTAKSVLNHGHHVVVIDGSGGVADFLAACYDHDTRLLYNTLFNFHDNELLHVKKIFIHSMICCPV